jgi:RimJ/RimL family protein N-acetyltransferase
MRFRPPVTLEGRFVTLRPLSRSDLGELHRAAQDPEIWRYLRYGDCTRLENLARFVDGLLECQAAQTDLPFAIVQRDSGRAVGMTRYMNIEREHEAVEIGGTWLARPLWRSPLNTEAKWLMMRHAFEAEGCHRVQIKTDVRNERSQRAIERLGAQREGVLREHMVTPDGYHRSSAVYSVLVSEWPAVRARLEGYLAQPWSVGPASRSTLSEPIGD